MKLGVCRLCDSEKELRKSHVIPRAVFKSAFKGYNYGRIIDRKFNKVVNTQDQWATYLLCADCEHELNVNYEQYSLDVLRNKSKTVKYQEKNEYLQLVNVDQRRLVLYVISVLWRAIESDHIIFGNLDELSIGSSVKTLFQKCVKDKLLPRNTFFSVRISKLKTIISEFKDMKLDFISNFTCKLDHKRRIRFLFIFEGYCYEVFLHTNPTDNLAGLGVLKNNKRILKLPYIEAFSIPELVDNLNEMIEANKNI